MAAVPPPSSFVGCLGDFTNAVLAYLKDDRMGVCLDTYGNPVTQHLLRILHVHRIKKKSESRRLLQFMIMTASFFLDLV